MQVQKSMVSLHSLKLSQSLFGNFYPTFSNRTFFLKKYLQFSFCTKAIPEELDQLDTGNVASQRSVITSNLSANLSNVDEGDLFGQLKIPMEKQKQPKVNKPRKFEEEKGLKRSKQVYSNKMHFSDKFGNLSDKNSLAYLPMDDPEPCDDSTVFYPERKYKTAEAYLKEMKSLVAQKRLKEALELFPDMKEHNIFPIHANYTYMIGACGRAGYTEMAFKLLRQMTDRGFRPTSATLTGLFNSCAECPFPEYGLRKARELKEKALERNWLLTKPTYHAMIKSFGKCGDIETSFQVVDEMISAGFTLTTKTYNFLLMSCVSDREAGFTHSVEVWRKMLSKKLKPDLYSFNLLLRAVRDCGIGPKEISSLLLQHWSSYRKRPYGLNDSIPSSSEELLKLANPEFAIGLENGFKSNNDNLSYGSTKLEEGHDEKVLQSSSSSKNSEPEILVEKNSSISSRNVPPVLPNILLKRPVTELVFFDLLSITSPSDRLALVGNAKGFLTLMKEFHIDPDIKTFTLLLENLPSEAKSENELLSLMDSHRISPDVDFFNILIKKRNFRNDYLLAKNVLLLINKYSLSPDIVTFGVLALGCEKSKHGLKLLEEMKKLGFHPNIEIMGALVRHACHKWDFDYLKVLLNEMKDLDLKPNEKVLTKIEEMVENVKQAIVEKEHGKEVKIPYPYETLNTMFKQFNSFYMKWLKSMEVEVDEHPWKQYETDIIYHEK